MSSSLWLSDGSPSSWDTGNDPIKRAAISYRRILAGTGNQGKRRQLFAARPSRLRGLLKNSKHFDKGAYIVREYTTNHEDRNNDLLAVDGQLRPAAAVLCPADVSAATGS